MLLIARRFKVINKKFIINDFFVKNFVVYVFYIRNHDEDKKDFKNVYKFRKVQINVTIQDQKNDKKQKIKISKEWQHIEKFFKKDLTYELSKHKFNDYVIDFEKKTQFLYNFIYSFSKLKLKILKTYIEKHFVNNFI